MSDTLNAPAAVQRSLQPSRAALPAPGANNPRVIKRVRAWLDKRFLVLATVPAFVAVTAVTIVPVLLGIWLSFTNYQPLDPTLKWAGLVNYQNIINGPDSFFAHAVIKNTLIFVGAGIVVETVLGVMLALVLARQMRGWVFFAPCS